MLWSKEIPARLFWIGRVWESNHHTQNIICKDTEGIRENEQK